MVTRSQKPSAIRSEEYRGKRTSQLLQSCRSRNHLQRLPKTSNVRFKTSAIFKLCCLQPPSRFMIMANVLMKKPGSTCLILVSYLLNQARYWHVWFYHGNFVWPKDRGCQKETLWGEKVPARKNTSTQISKVSRRKSDAYFVRVYVQMLQRCSKVQVKMQTIVVHQWSSKQQALKKKVRYTSR